MEPQEKELTKAYHRLNINTRLFSCKHEIESYSKHDFGWDGDGSVPISTLTRTTATEFLDKVGEMILLIDEDYIYPTCDGTIVIDFQNNLDDLASIEIRQSNVGFFLQTDGGISKVGSGAKESIDAISFVWGRSDNKDLPVMGK